MIRSTTRLVIPAVCGGLAGALLFIVAFTRGPAFVLEMDRPLPRHVVSGFYPPERAGELTFAWTSRRADVTLSGMDRRLPWECLIHFRGGGPNLNDQSLVDVAVDGVTLVRRVATDEFQSLRVTVPQRSLRRGLTLSITSTTTFVPGPSDQRELGIQVDRLACQPATPAVILPPLSAIRDAAAASAIFAAAFALAGIALGPAAGAALPIAAGQAVLLSTGAAPYGDFPRTMLVAAAWIAVLAVALLKLLEVWSWQRLSSAARLVMFFSAGAFYLKLLGLLHPSKLPIDAIFHAHRFEWVLAGRYYFTQVMPSGVTFPYAIGLYVFASPWSVLTDDYVALLRVVVSASEVVAGALLYPLIVRIWRDRLTAAVAVVLFNVVPLPYGLVGNANLTNAFGQSVALVSLVAAAILPLGKREVGPLLALFLVTSAAFLSHISTFALLFVTLMAGALMYRCLGAEELRRASRSIVLVTLLAAVFSVVTYYGHFGEVYKTALRVRASSAASDAGTSGDPERLEVSARLPGTTSLGTRMTNALDLTISTIGWPLLSLAILGIWHLWGSGARDRLVFTLAAWGIAHVAFFLVGVVMPVEAPFQRYAAEFVGRVNFATYPAAVIIAARGAGWAWRAGAVPRMAAAILLFLAVAGGVRHWAGWIA